MSDLAILPQHEQIDLLREHRHKELQQRRETYRQVLRPVCALTVHHDLIPATFIDGQSGNQDSP